MTEHFPPVGQNSTASSNIGMSDDKFNYPKKSCLKQSKGIASQNGGGHDLQKNHPVSGIEFSDSNSPSAREIHFQNGDNVKSENAVSSEFRRQRLDGRPVTAEKQATFYLVSEESDEAKGEENEHVSLVGAAEVYSDAKRKHENNSGVGSSSKHKYFAEIDISTEDDEEEISPKFRNINVDKTPIVWQDSQPKEITKVSFNVKQTRFVEKDDISNEDEEELRSRLRYNTVHAPTSVMNKRVSFSPVESEWRPGMIRSISEITEGSNMEQVHQDRYGVEDENDLNDRVRKFSGNREASRLLSKLDLGLAAQYVQDAMESRHMFFSADEQSLRRYKWYNKTALVVILYLFVFGDLCLVLFEKPAVPKLELPFWATMIPETIFIVFFAARVIHNFTFDRRKEYWKETRNIALIVTILLTVLDMISYFLIMKIAPLHVSKYAVRWTRVLRPVFLVSFPSGEKIRVAFTNVAKSIPEIFAVLFLLICSIAIFALVWYQLLRDKSLVTSSGAPYFVDYFDSFWDLYVLVTTANNPDVMLPAFDYSNWIAILWFVYMCVNLYIFLNIVLAVVYNGYKIRLKENVRMKVLMKRELLDRAFDVMKVDMGYGIYGFRSDRWHDIMSRVDKKFTPNKIDIMFTVLDDNQDGTIDRKEFLTLSELINYDLSEVVENTSFLEANFMYYHSLPSRFIRRVIEHNVFEYLIGLLIVMNAICIALDISLVEYFFLPFFTLEILLRIYTKSPGKYFDSIMNTFDFILIFTPLVILLVPDQYIAHETKKKMLDFLLVLRIIRVIRSARAIKQLNLILNTIGKIFPFIFTYGGVLFAFYYSYAIVGMEIFADRIHFHGYTNLTTDQLYCGNIHLNGSEFWIKKYCGCNFNDFYHACVVLFTQMVVNQWHEITNGFVLVTNKAARLYFIIFHLSCVLILLNIFSALVIEAFFLAYEVQRTDIETNLQKKIRVLGLLDPKQDEGSDNESEDDDSKAGIEDELMSATGFLPGRRKSVCDSMPTDVMLIQRRLRRNNRLTNMRFKIESKSNLRVETLIQRLFAGELEIGDDDEEKEEEDISEEEDLFNRHYKDRYSNKTTSL